VSDNVVPAGAAARLVRETLLRCVERTRAALAELARDDVDLCNPEGERRWAAALERITAEERERFRTELARWSAAVEQWERRVAPGAEVLDAGETLDDVLGDFDAALGTLREGAGG